MKKKRILFFVDHKYRDLKSSALISYYLKKYGYKTQLTALWNFDQIDKFDPDYIIFNKPHMFDREKIRNVLNNRYNICIPTEGQAHTRQPIINFPCDLNFFWNEYVYKFYSEISVKQKKVVGCQRTDFLKNKDNQILIKKRSKMNFLQTKKKNITFAIPDASLKFKGKKLKEYTNYVDESHKGECPNYLNYILEHRKSLKKLQIFLVQAAKKYKKLNFIIKPHPNDDHLIWEKFEKKYKNIHVIYGLDISEFLKISNLHITVEGCNTTFEALYNNISVGEICLEKTFAKKEMNNITLNLCENKIHTFKNFDNLIYDIFFNKKNFINKGKLKTYIKFHFHRVDDKRCKKYAENIKKFINQKNNETSFNRFVYIILIFFRFPRNFKYSYFIVKELIKKLLNYKSNKKVIKKIKFNKIDKRGRFDSRMVNGDEEEYYKYFKNVLKI